MEKKIDVLAFLEGIVQQNTVHYPSDFLYDREALQSAAREPDAENRTFLWMSRPSGTWCFREREVFLRQTAAYAVWTYYAGQPEGIRAFRVKLDSVEKDSLLGAVQELDYPRQARRVMEQALSAQAMDVFFEDGTVHKLRCDEYASQCYDLTARHGPVKRVRYHPKDERELAQVLRAERMLSAPAKKQQHKRR